MSVGRMRVLRSALVLFAAFALSLSLAVPVEDLPETPFDESESLPYEITPRCSVVQQQPGIALELEFPLQLHLEAKGKGLARHSKSEAQPTFDSIAILDHSLRC